MRGETWSPDMDATLAQLAGDGATAREAAAVLGMTRNAILGRSFRTGVKFKRRVIERQAKPPKEPRAPRVGRVRVPRIYISAPQKEHARALYLQGETYSKISAATGIAAGNLSVYFKDLPRRRVVTCSSKPKPRTLKLEALSLRLAGLSGAKVAARLGFSEHSLVNWKRDAALTREAQLIADRLIVERRALAVEAELRARLERQEQLAAIAANNAPILPSLTPRQRMIVEMRIAGKSLQEVGDILGVTRERVRQIEARCRTLGIMIPDQRPLSDSAARLFGLKPPRVKRERPTRPPKGERRPYRLSPEERQRRSDRLRQLWAAR